MSQFSSLFKTDAKEERKTEKTPPRKTAPKPKTKPEKKKPDSTSLSPAPQPPVAKADEPATPRKSAPTQKRAPGKSSNSDYAQVLTYVRRDTHRAVKRALLDDEQNRNLSDLVEELLAGWVKKQKTD